jgi:MFS family permease
MAGARARTIGARLGERAPMDDAAASPAGGYAGLIFVVCLAQVMMTADYASLGVMTPTIGRDLALGPETLTWVAAANGLTFASFLILGGRLADLYGRRLCCLTGLALFGLGSILAGFATGAGLLIAGRVVQGLALAVLAPANFALLNAVLPEGRVRNRAFGWFSAAQGAALILGFAVGGALTTALGWRSVFLAEAPLAAVTLALAWRFVPREPMAPGDRRLDVIGAVLVTAGAGLLVASPTLIGKYGWTSAMGLAPVAAGLATFALFFLVEARTPNALTPPSLLRAPNLLGANLAMLFLLAAGAAIFFLPNLYMQQVLHYSAMQSGLGMLPQAATVIAIGPVVTLCMNRLSVRTNLIIGPVILIAGMLLFSRASEHGGYFVNVLPALAISAAGGFLATMMLMIAATQGAQPAQHSVASAFAFMTQQLGMALGVSIALTIVAAGQAHGEAAIVAVRYGFFAAAAVAAVGLAVVLALIRRPGPIATAA